MPVVPNPGRREDNTVAIAVWDFAVFAVRAAVSVGSEVPSITAVILT
jgi:hypothetical protein